MSCPVWDQYYVLCNYRIVFDALVRLTTCNTMIRNQRPENAILLNLLTHLGANIADETQQYSCVANGVCRVDAQPILQNRRHEDEEERVDVYGYHDCGREELPSSACLSEALESQLAQVAVVAQMKAVRNLRHIAHGSIRHDLTAAYF